MQDEKLAARVRWRCRRGMLELDAVLDRFYRQSYSDLSPLEQAQFDELLDSEDPDLQAWLLFGDTYYDEKFSQIIARIRMSNADRTSS